MVFGDSGRVCRGMMSTYIHIARYIVDNMLFLDQGRHCYPLHMDQETGFGIVVSQFLGETIKSGLVSIGSPI